MRLIVLKICLVFLAFLVFTEVKADRRFYVWTYQYQTLEKGTAELEYYNTISSTNFQNFKNNTTSQHRVELEIGMTDRFDVAIYQNFSQSPGKSLDYDGFQLRARYRLGDKGKWFVDPLIYLEYEGVPDFTTNKLEAKLILSKDLGGLNFSLNPMIELEKEHELEIIPGYAFGMSYEFSETLRAGVELKGDKDGHFIAPVIAHGLGGLWIAFAPTFMLGKVPEGKPEFFFRMVLGVHLK